MSSRNKQPVVDCERETTVSVLVKDVRMFLDWLEDGLRDGVIERATVQPYIRVTKASSRKERDC